MFQMKYSTKSKKEIKNVNRESFEIGTSKCGDKFHGSPLSPAWKLKQTAF